MKTIRILLFTLLFLSSFAAEAQNVVLYKKGYIVKQYTAEQVDSVVYVPAKEAKCYYYVGTEKPTTDAEIEALGTATMLRISEISVTSMDAYQYFAYPKVWGESPDFTVGGMSISIPLNIQSLNDAFNKNPDSKYYCRRIGKNIGNVIIKINW